jgi:hypothetical protein
VTLPSKRTQMLIALVAIWSNCEVLLALSGFRAFLLQALPDIARTGAVTVVLIGDLALVLVCMVMLWAKRYREFLFGASLVALLLVAYTVGSDTLRNVSKENARATAISFLKDRRAYKATYEDESIALQIDAGQTETESVELVYSSPPIGRYEFRVNQSGAPPYIVLLYTYSTPSFFLYREQAGRKADGH